MSVEVLDLVLLYLLPWDLVSCIRLNKHFYALISKMLEKELEEAKKITQPPHENFHRTFSVYHNNLEIRKNDIIISMVFQLCGINSSLKNKIVRVINQTSHLRIKYPSFNGHAESGNTMDKFVKFLPYAYKYIPIEIMEFVAIAYIEFGSQNSLAKLEKLKEAGLSFQKPLKIYSMTATSYITPLVLSGLTYFFFNSVYVKTILIGIILLFSIPVGSRTLDSHMKVVQNARGSSS